MREVLIVGLVLLGVVAIADFKQKENPPQSWRDDNTGCQYLLYQDKITPRWDKDGRQICQ